MYSLRHSDYFSDNIASKNALKSYRFKYVLAAKETLRIFI